MPLSEEPNLGHWTIFASENIDQTTSITFEVKKYVLPKFEVTIDHFDKIRVDEPKFNVTVCAK